MESADALKIAVLPGDGIGVDVTHAVIPIFAALNIPVQLSFGDIGWSYWQHEGTPVPERTWKLIAESDTALLGAITSKAQREANKELAKTFQNKHLNYISPIIQLRQKLDLFANVRPCFSIKDEHNKFNLCIIRENTEGLYSGFDYSPVPDSIIKLLAENPHWRTIPPDEISCALRLQSKSGLTRLFEYAFKYADEQGMQRVTFADKANVLRQSAVFSRDIFEQLSAQYPHIHADILNVDAVALWLIKRPEEFGVIVAENMFGDILSDVGAGVMGGLGFAPSANIGHSGSYFEPVHGSAPRIKSNSANPCAMFLTISMLLNHFGYINPAKKIIKAIIKVVTERRFVTYDLGGNATTSEMAHAIIDQCLQLPHHSDSVSFTLKEDRVTHTLNDNDRMREYLEVLQKFNTAEISDALDASGVEGCLLHIKPLIPGIKLIGPAYTLKYSLNKAKSTTFKHAANYIDSIPAKSVLIIDNDGRTDCTTWGDILTQVAMHKEIAGTVIHGASRDAASIRAAKYPLFCTAIYMRSGKNRIHKSGEQCALVINGVTINPGDIIFADDNGVLVIPRHLVPDIINKAHNIKHTEKNILAAVKKGSSLEQARLDFHYNQPWLGINNKD